ncbi:MAG: hypothetical protein GVY07_02160 [Bacteroidetes bacterium]|jgi:hypothetical protein|nr:hypothetical protein [Bacteroidota bacterium]
MFKKSVFLFALAFFMSGCYHAQVTTGLEASSEVYQKKWANGFIAGLVPPDIVDATEHCSNGVAKVETRHSFLNMVAQAITFSLYSPMEITVTCASGTGAVNGYNEPIELAKSSSNEAQQKTYSEAISVATETQKPVYIEFK